MTTFLIILGIIFCVISYGIMITDHKDRKIWFNNQGFNIPNYMIIIICSVLFPGFYLLGFIVFTVLKTIKKGLEVK